MMFFHSSTPLFRLQFLKFNTNRSIAYNNIKQQVNMELPIAIPPHNHTRYQHSFILQPFALHIHERASKSELHKLPDTIGFVVVLGAINNGSSIRLLRQAGRTEKYLHVFHQLEICAAGQFLVADSTGSYRHRRGTEYGRVTERRRNASGKV